MPFGFVAVRHGSTGGKPCVDTARTLQAWGRRFEPGTLHPRKQLEHAVCGTRLRARIRSGPWQFGDLVKFGQIRLDPNAASIESLTSSIPRACSNSCAYMSSVMLGRAWPSWRDARTGSTPARIR